jgi:hypothetical protein
MYSYSNNEIIDEETLDKCNFNIIDEGLIQYGSGYKLSPLIMEAEKERDEQLIKLYKILRKASELKLQPNSVNEPYSSQSKEPLSATFSHNELDILAQIIPRVNCLAFRARLHDLCWLYCKPKAIKNAYETIDLYTSYPINADTWMDGTQNYYERALSLAFQLGKGALSRVNEIKSKLSDALNLEYKDSKFMKLWIARLLKKFDLNKEAPEQTANDFVLVARNLALGQDYYSARHYLEYAADSYRLLDHEAWIGTLIRIAETWEQEALCRDQAFIRMTFYEDAIQAYRKVPKLERENHGIDEKINKLRLKLRDEGKTAISEMASFSIKSPDIKDDIDSAIEHVSGKENLDFALLFFCGLYSGVSKSGSIDSAKDSMKFGIASRLFSSVQLSADGRKIGQEKSITFTPDESLEEIPMSKAVEAAVFNANFFVQSQLLPALSTILNEHHISLNTLENLCAICPVIPDNRAKLFAKGLFLGFEYDFATAVHLLVPQWEHMVRTMLKESDIHTTILNPDGIDMECGLSTLLDKDETAEIFDDDLLFQMVAFLTHKRGPNLRNEIAHGLLDDNNACNTSSIYWWWRSLQFVIYSSANI